LDLIERGCKLFDRLYVAVAANSRKTPWFDLSERMAIIRDCTSHLPNVEVIQIEGLTVHFAEQLGAQFILRGLRAVSDFDFEFQLAIMNHELKPNVETIFLATSPEYVFLSSSMVKEVWSLGGDVSRFVPARVVEAFLHRKGD
jgi:pantetheine-phosphate adenylyltransferase